MAEKFKCSPINKVGHLKKAMLAYRNIPNKKDKIKQLKQELDEIDKLISNNVNRYVICTASQREFEELLQKELLGPYKEECLSKLVNLCIDCLCNMYDCIMSAKPESPLSAMLLYNDNRMNFDHDGKTIHSKISGNISFNLKGVCQTLSDIIQRGLVIIKEKHSFSEKEILDIIKTSCFIPNNHHDFFAKELNYFLRGEVLEAVVLLIPQVEACLMHILSKNNVNTNVLSSDETEGYIIDCKKIFSLCRENKVLNEKLIFYLQTLLVDSDDSLRHSISHGKVDNTIVNDLDCHIACMIISFLSLELTGVLEFKFLRTKKMINMFDDRVKDVLGYLARQINSNFWAS